MSEGLIIPGSQSASTWQLGVHSRSYEIKIKMKNVMCEYDRLNGWKTYFLIKVRNKHMRRKKVKTVTIIYSGKV